MQQVIEQSENGSRRAVVSYVYNHTLYDLRVQGARRLGPTSFGAYTFDDLVRLELALVNRVSADVTKLGITYVPGETVPRLPVQFFYQPSFWIRVELRLDDSIDPPADPASDSTVLTRIRAICGAAGVGHSDRD